MDYDTDFDTKLTWWQHAILLTGVIATPVAYVVNLYTHFIY